ncbi:hypothetical protein P4I89_08255 [Bacillus cereus]|uniref:uracil-DNA glycosylase family protein n=1 Tax=Bacillus thuringiensis TaxID=1428 RepID=UPI0012988E17|nr:uracil-DNA glycosylase family protein [Bacillus thuringiensis]MDR5047825.1 hypothetical protein [Bacillus thuringiensis]MEB9509489.1 hypothetical protein [Bacillus cereus]MRC76507.1 hypothetical protein [Bacillus thuringiensis]
MNTIEVESPFDTADVFSESKTKLEPGYYNEILMPEHIYKKITPFDIKTSVHNCFACDNCKFAKPLELSNFDASIMIIGQVPSDVDIRTPEGKILIDTLSWSGYNLNDIYLTSLVKCEDSTQPEQCQHHLVSELLCVQPKMVIALGYDVGKYFDPTINQAGYQSVLMGRYNMITTYRTLYTMENQNLFQELCGHILRAKQQMEITV